MKKNRILFALGIFLAGMSACIPSPPNPGFRVTTTRTTFNEMLFPVTLDAPGISVYGHTVGALAPPSAVSGTVGAFIGSTNSNAYYDVKGGQTPYLWSLGENSGPCAGQSDIVYIPHGGSTQNLDCRQIPVAFFAFSPASIERDSPPAYINIDGTGISSDSGMPTVQYYDTNGTLISQNTAFQAVPDGISSNGTLLSAPTPDLSLFISGEYVVTVTNPDGTVAGSGLLVIFDYLEPPPDPDPGEDPGCGSGGECIIY